MNHEDLWFWESRRRRALDRARRGLAAAAALLNHGGDRDVVTEFAAEYEPEIVSLADHARHSAVLMARTTLALDTPDPLRVQGRLVYLDEPLNGWNGYREQPSPAALRVAVRDGIVPWVLRGTRT